MQVSSYIKHDFEMLIVKIIGKDCGINKKWELLSAEKVNNNNNNNFRITGLVNDIFQKQTRPF